MKQKYPDQIYCVTEYDGNDKKVSFLTAYKTPEDFAEAGESIECAIYKRVRLAKVVSRVKVI